jgi:hypothetical protein
MKHIRQVESRIALPVQSLSPATDREGRKGDAVFRFHRAPHGDDLAASRGDGADSDLDQPLPEPLPLKATPDRPGEHLHLTY